MQRELVERGDEASERRAAERLFYRDLPGGGYVAIDVADGDRVPGDRTVRVIVERRASRERRLGHRPPVMREDRWRSESDFGELYRLATDNAAIARELMALRGSRADQQRSILQVEAHTAT